MSSEEQGEGKGGGRGESKFEERQDGGKGRKRGK
jgi:hypothetical protein